MQFKRHIMSLSKKVREVKDSVLLEEATKHHLVLPLLTILGYDYTNPLIVEPEFTADFSNKNAKKVDYALLLENNQGIILMEVKHHSENLERHVEQLVNYFNNLKPKRSVEFGILTNGLEYQFFTDLSNDNLLDTEPFMVVNLEEITLESIDNLRKFCRKDFDVRVVKSFAREIRYRKFVSQYLKTEASNPSDDFIRFINRKIEFKKPALLDAKNVVRSVFSEILFPSCALRNNRVVVSRMIDEKTLNNNNRSNEENTKNLERLAKSSIEVQNLNKILENFIFTLDNVEKYESQHYTGYRIVGGKLFADLVFRPKRNVILITVKVPLEKVCLKEGFVRDVSGIGTYGNGNIEIVFVDESQFEEVKRLIRLSFDLCN
ncbi:hypothetical protein DB313_00450 [Borrelia turcica IST7]|uniref:Type I restriction enzyme R protein N-terminal domain-containing protein n=1 Tax=Borrelia turcica IST7 TaxID=1104446 RepID=A0A386PJF6_9SPIR|nr:type I restriction endonuclease [Borrelia turcica]AYE35984.1 hypothetical protein DB313_00450 [Borrelia turcica IST7]